MEDYITLTNFKNNAVKYLEQFDIYIMSSQREGLPLTIYEAFAKKIPVISTKAVGIPEVIEHQKNGYLVEIGDYESLAKGLKEYFDNSDKLKEYTEISYNLFHSKFTSKQNAIETLKLYKEVLI